MGLYSADPLLSLVIALADLHTLHITNLWLGMDVTLTFHLIDTQNVYSCSLFEVVPLKNLQRCKPTHVVRSDSSFPLIIGEMNKN